MRPLAAVLNKGLHMRAANHSVMYNFSPIALQQLRDVGWTEDRRFDISEYVQRMRDLGIELFPCVGNFAMRYGNLRFRRRESAHKGIPTNKWILGPAWLDTTFTATETWEVQMSAINNGVYEVTLQAIGFDPGSGYWTAMDRSGFVYTSLDRVAGWVSLVGYRAKTDWRLCSLVALRSVLT